MKKSVFTIAVFFAVLAVLSGDNISISGIDTGSMMFNGNVALYLNITDNSGTPVRGLTAEDLEVYESADGSSFSPAPVIKFTAGQNEQKGIRFQLLLDNSGSMYDRIDGKAAANFEETRLFAAVNALKSLIQSMQGSRDKTGLSVFNTYYRELVPIGTNRNLVVESMASIEKPGKDESFTELNAAVCTAAGNFSDQTGRKIMIVLSDGENYPFYKIRKSESPQFGTELYSTDDMITELKTAGATLYAISFAGSGDPELEKAAIATGGLLFSADTEEDLKKVYSIIRNRVLNEYYLEYRSGREYGERKYVKARLSSGADPSGTLFFFSGNLFGMPSENYNWLYLLAVPGAFVILLFLVFQKMSSPAEKAGLEVTDFTGATQMFSLEGQKTVIGGSDRDDVTVVSAQQDRQSNATIVYDAKKSQYTVVSDEPVYVNNNPVKTRVLEPGDVISMNGATIIFNDKEGK